ncbi:hypothetical protein RJ641_014623 [Dillenia turbinata]|uniref:Uncharacterized protein n=1 Tax=Dillenia turbinata TaxID=194707 RepID=A0AAN8USG3_9MAGN
MNSLAISPFFSSSKPIFNNCTQKWLQHLNPTNFHLTLCPSSSPFSSRKKKKTKNNTDPKLQMVIDIEALRNRASMSIQRFINSSRAKFDRFVFTGREAFEDFQTLVTVDHNKRVIISCRRSSLEFVGNLVIWGFVVVFVFRVLKELGLGFGSKLGFGYGGSVWKRDRSLGGKEVIVGRRKQNKKSDNYLNVRVLSNPLSPARDTLGLPRNSGSIQRRTADHRRQEKLPKWWPDSLPQPVLTVNKEKHQREVNRLIRVILDYKMSGRDIMEDDILRRICRISGARVVIDTSNARDSLYRASVEFVLNICSSHSHSTFIQIDGEEPQQFLAGLAENIGLEKIRAARIVSAAVAARMRSRFLQAWALEMQNNHSEAVAELSKICCLLHVFPPDESSPEMEMLAQGLEKHFKEEQREYLMKMLMEVCGEELRCSAAQALSLVARPLEG